MTLDWQYNNMHHAFWYISLSPLHDYDVKLLNFTFCGGCEHTTMTFFFFSCTSTQSFRIQVHKKIANIWRIERNRISAIKFEAARLHFLSDVFAAAAVVVAIRSLISSDFLPQNCRCFRPARILRYVTQLQKLQKIGEIADFVDTGKFKC